VASPLDLFVESFFGAISCKKNIREVSSRKPIKTKAKPSKNCGSNAFKGYFDDAKEFKNQERDSREVSCFKFSRIKNQE